MVRSICFDLTISTKDYLMAGQVAVIEDGHLLGRLDRYLLRLEKFLCFDKWPGDFVSYVFGRLLCYGSKIFNAPLAGYVDYIEAAMPIIAIMGVSYVQRDGSHIRMDIFVSFLRGRALWLFELLSIVLILVLILALTWGAWVHFDRSFDCARPFCSRDSSIDIGLPIWPSKLVFPCF